MQKDPSQMRFTFCTLYSKSKKKKFQFAIFFTFFFRIWLHLVRGFQKGITLGYLGHVCRFWSTFCTFFAQNNSGALNLQNMMSIPKCYTFLESSHQMQSYSEEKSKKNYKLKDFIFLDLLYKVQIINCTWEVFFAWAWKILLVNLLCIRLKYPETNWEPSSFNGTRYSHPFLSYLGA